MANWTCTVPAEAEQLLREWITFHRRTLDEVKNLIITAPPGDARRMRGNDPRREIIRHELDALDVLETLLDMGEVVIASPPKFFERSVVSAISNALTVSAVHEFLGGSMPPAQAVFIDWLRLMHDAPIGGQNSKPSVFGMRIRINDRILSDQELSIDLGREIKRYKPEALTTEAQVATERRTRWTYAELSAFVNEIKVPSIADAKDIAWPLLQKHSAGGFLFQLCWHGTCIKSGNPLEVRSAKHYVSAYAAENEVCQLVLKAAIQAAEHEIRERFEYRGVPVYRPHQPLDALRGFTKGHAEELRPAISEEA